MGTTLGADDGIAVAMILALLDSDNKRPPVEAVFTTDEETGMDGAKTLTRQAFAENDDKSRFGGRGSIYRKLCRRKQNALHTSHKREEYDGETLKITVSGLKGGHSGAEIHRGRANADMLLGRILNYVLPICEARIISVDGGLKDNAIPTSAEAIVKTKNPKSSKSSL